MSAICTSCHQHETVFRLIHSFFLPALLITFQALAPSAQEMPSTPVARPFRLFATPEEHERGKKAVKEIEDRRAQLLGVVKQESISQTLATLLRQEMFSRDCIPPFASTRHGDDIVYKNQYLALYDFRFAKCMSISINGSLMEKEVLFDAAMLELETYVTKRKEGSTVEPDAACFIAWTVLPYILGELDTEGKSLPWLEEWYRMDLIAAKEFTDFVNETRLSEGKSTVPGTSIFSSAYLLAWSAARIIDRMELPNSASKDIIRKYTTETRSFKPVQSYTDWISDLAGIQICPHLSLTDSESVMAEIAALASL
ncbi:MAG: hypothetical protein AMXMBFR84_25170 [Candidatus Hydrogenedentota bacterium]